MKKFLTISFLILCSALVFGQGTHTGGGGGGGSGGVTRVAGGTQVLSTSSISSGTCVLTGPTAVSGVLTTDTVTTSFNSDPTGVAGYQPLATGMLTIIPFPTTGNVNFEVCNNTAALITPGAITLNYVVTR